VENLVSLRDRIGLDLRGQTASARAEKFISNPAQAISISRLCFSKLDHLNFQGHYMNAFETLQDMIEGREYLTKLVG
jgi:hypothetical protein